MLSVVYWPHHHYWTYLPQLYSVLDGFQHFQGYSRFQLKLGGNLSDDIERLRLCRGVLGPDDILIGDANTG
jgi:L-alanine-DL-glutamate epimerase-like enolase superfamily enzyme